MCNVFRIISEFPNQGFAVGCMICHLHLRSVVKWQRYENVSYGLLVLYSLHRRNEKPKLIRIRNSIVAIESCMNRGSHCMTKISDTRSVSCRTA